MKGKISSIIIVAEGEKAGGAFEVDEELKKLSGNEYRVVVLGHLQRGGAPTASDRILATKLGAFAVEVLERGDNGVMVGEVEGELLTTPLKETWGKKKDLDKFLLGFIRSLAS